MRLFRSAAVILMLIPVSIVIVGSLASRIAGDADSTASAQAVNATVLDGVVVPSTSDLVSVLMARVPDELVMMLVGSVLIGIGGAFRRPGPRQPESQPAIQAVQRVAVRVRRPRPARRAS